MSSKQAINETIDVLDDLSNVFRSSEDLQMVKQTQQHLLDLEQLTAHRNEELKSYIRELSTSVQTLQQDTKDSPSKPFIDAQERLEQEKQELSQALVQMEEEKSGEETRVKKLASDKLTLEKKTQETIETAHTSIPTAKNLLKLYTTIANVTWDYDHVNDSKGFVHMLNAQEIRPFHLTESSVPCPVDRVDRIWNIMWEDQQQTTTTTITGTVAGAR
jgi:uncharacterized protein YukE